MTRIRIPLLLLLTLIASCTNSQEPPPHAPPAAMAFAASPIDLQGIDAVFAGDIHYDTHAETTFDIFMPASAAPTGLVIYIHGGGFRTGDKSWIYSGSTFPDDIREFLAAGVAVATINYRLLVRDETKGILKPLHDARRALQFIRFVHKPLNIDKRDIVLYGSSAGAGIALWLAANDDMRTLSPTDPVAGESTRVKGVALHATQASYDMERRWVDDVFADFGVTWEDATRITSEERIFQFYGVGSWPEYESPAIDAYRQQVDMLSLLSPGDPEIWILNDSNGNGNGLPTTEDHANHHPFHAREIKQYADAAGVPTVCRYGMPVLYSDPEFGDYVPFLMRKLGERPAGGRRQMRDEVR
jgi:pimeloyl-ACP methyl ester carboxylesterase